MDVTAVTTGRKAGAALGMTGRLREALDNYLLYHRIESSTDATIKFYAKEVRLFLKDVDPDCQTLQDLTPLHVLKHLASMKDRGLAPRSVRSRWQAITTWLNWCRPRSSSMSRSGERKERKTRPSGGEWCDGGGR